SSRSTSVRSRHPELGLDLQLVDRVHEHGQVEAQTFQEHLVELRVREPGADAPAELPLDRAERRLDVAALVVVREEVVALEGEVVPHAPPRGGAGAAAIDLVRHVWHTAELEADPHGRGDAGGAGLSAWALIILLREAKKVEGE